MGNDNGLEQLAMSGGNSMERTARPGINGHRLFSIPLALTGSLVVGAIFAGIAFGVGANDPTTIKHQMLQQERVQQEIARSKPQPPKHARTVGVTTVDVWPSGIIVGGGPAPYPSTQFVAYSQWQEIFGGRHVTVYTGGSRYGSAVGMVVVMLTSLDGLDNSFEHYTFPQAGGALRIKSATGLTLILESSAGRSFTFDVPSRQFKAS